MKRIKQWIENARWKKRVSLSIHNCGCACYCPCCSDLLNDQAMWEAQTDQEGVTGEGWYTCITCKTKSKWHFGIAPVPILLQDNTDIIRKI